MTAVIPIIFLIFVFLFIFVIALIMTGKNQEDRAIKKFLDNKPKSSSAIRCKYYSSSTEDCTCANWTVCVDSSFYKITEHRSGCQIKYTAQKVLKN
jgi:hypothetical protein